MVPSFRRGRSPHPAELRRAGCPISRVLCEKWEWFVAEQVVQLFIHKMPRVLESLQKVSHHPNPLPFRTGRQAR